MAFEDLSLNDYIQILFRRKRVIFVVFLFSVLLTVLLAMLAACACQLEHMWHAQVNNLSVRYHAQTVGLGVAHCRQDGGVPDGNPF